MMHHQTELRKKIRGLQRNRGFQQSEMLSIMRLANTEITMILPLITAFPFLSRIITLPGLCSFFPDQLLEIYLDIKEAGLVTLGGRLVPGGIDGHTTRINLKGELNWKLIKYHRGC